MPGKTGVRKQQQHRQPLPAAAMPACESLVATEDEKNPTSKSLYGDHLARISANLPLIHDRPRIAAFTGAIQNGMKGKTVLHLGCGIGLFSMIAARAMAKLVVAVDISGVVGPAAEVARRNHLDNVTFLHGNVSELKLPVDKFDVILCDWTGPFLTNEKLLRDLLYCKKHFLAPGGYVCPDRSSLHIVAITDFPYYDDSVGFWDNVYGFSMSPMKPLVAQEATTGQIPRRCVVTDSHMVTTIDINRLSGEGTDADLAYSAPFSISVRQKSTLHFFTFFVDCSFTNPENPAVNFVLGFNPGGYNTCTEVSVMLREALPVFPGDVVSGTVTVKPHEKATEIVVEYHCKNALVDMNATSTYTFFLLKEGKEWGWRQTGSEPGVCFFSNK